MAQTRVIDGDTFVMDGETFRINGIDAPEHGQTCGNWGCGRAATDALATLIDGQSVDCVTHARDTYGRAIATCYVAGQDLGQSLVDSGAAWAFLKYTDTYADAQEKAKTLGLGVWSGNYQTPWDFRQVEWANAAKSAPSGCPIKGNITANGHIYHAPWSPWYDRTRISTRKGERWFCSEAEAIAAGWRPPHWQ